jgi:cysteine desulfurase
LIYLDNHATTQPDPKVVAVMLPWLHTPANTGSKHRLGQLSRAAVEKARCQVAGLINASPREIIFTSGATESNNLAIKGSGHDQVVLPRYEHKSILEAVGDRKANYLEVGPDGLVDPDDVAKALAEAPKLVSVMWANNEVGTINDIAAIGKLSAPWGGLLHSDAAQALGKVPIDVKAAGVALLSMSSHKMHGPQGVGALFVSKSKPRVRLDPLLEGGGQERGMRSGTLNVAGIVGFGEACAIAQEHMTVDALWMMNLRQQLLEGLLAAMPNIMVNGTMNRLPGNLNISIPGVVGAHLVEALADTVAISNGSACNSGTVEPSYVLESMGIHPIQALESVRFGLSKFNTKTDVVEAVKLVTAAVGALQGSTRG